MHKYFLYCLLIFSSLSFSEKKTLTIQADIWYPVSDHPDSSHPGYMIEMAKLMLSPHGYTVDYQLSPWNRAVFNARSGTIDCIVGATQKEAKGLLMPELSWGLDISGIYVLASDPWRATNMEDLLERRLGLITGYEYGDSWDEFFAKHKGKTFQYVSGEDPLKLNLSKLMAGKIDSIFETTFVMDAYLKRNDLEDQIIFAGELGPRLNLYIACNDRDQKNIRAIELFNQALPRMRDNGELETLLKPYGLKDWVNKQVK